MVSYTVLKIFLKKVLREQKTSQKNAKQKNPCLSEKSILDFFDRQGSRV